MWRARAKALSIDLFGFYGNCSGSSESGANCSKNFMMVEDHFVLCQLGRCSQSVHRRCSVHLGEV